MWFSEWTNEMTVMMMDGIKETLFMTLLSTLFGYLLGLPMGIALAVTDKNGVIMEEVLLEKQHSNTTTLHWKNLFFLMKMDTLIDTFPIYILPE